MHRTITIHIKRGIALLLLAVMVLMHMAKTIHRHHTYCDEQQHHHGKLIIKDDGRHSCSICEFQLAKDGLPASSTAIILIPTFASPTYARLLTSLNADYFFLNDSRGPPQA